MFLFVSKPLIQINSYYFYSVIRIFFQRIINIILFSIQKNDSGFDSEIFLGNIWTTDQTRNISRNQRSDGQSDMSQGI